jgi:transposase-like protein
MSKRSPLTPAERKQILKMHGDGYTQLMIANHVGVHRHSVANVVAKAGDATPTELRAEIARLKGELAKRDKELAALRRVKGPDVAAALRPRTAEARVALTSGELRALSASTPPRDAPPEVAAAGVEAVLYWHVLEAERHLGEYPVPCAPFGGWTEVRMRAWLAQKRGELEGVAGGFGP